MNLKIKRFISIILIIINCLVIFNFSAQNSDKSSKTSGVIVDRIVNIISNINKNVKKESLQDTITFIVRKMAHFTIYTLLGIWLMCFMNTFNASSKTKFITCILYGMLYAISDEFHQYFVGGRSAEIRDVCIDTFGVFCGSIICFFSWRRINKSIYLRK